MDHLVLVQSLYILNWKLITVQTIRVSHKQHRESPTQPTTNHLFLIKNIQINEWRHQLEKKKQAEGTLELTQDHTFTWTKEKISKYQSLLIWKYVYSYDVKSH